MKILRNFATFFKHQSLHIIHQNEIYIFTTFNIMP